MREVIRASSLYGFRKLAEELGGEPDEIARDAGVNLEDALLPDKFIPARTLYHLMNRAAERLQRLDFGLLWGQRAEPGGLGPLFTAIANAATGREAIQMVTRFLHTHAPVALVFLKPLPSRGHDLIGIRNFVANPPCLAQMFEQRTAAMHKLLRLICGPDYRPAEIWLPHEPISPAATYEQVFGLRPRFAMEVAGVAVHPKLLDAARPGANPVLKQMAEAYLRSIGPPANDSFTAEASGMVRILISSSDVTAALAASALGVHERTLQRRLQDEGASFERIKDDVRRAMAEALIADVETPITEISEALHYSSPAAFSRSCRRWFGDSPRNLRKKLAKSEETGWRPVLSLSGPQELPRVTAPSET
jgi:AraC-like DNA-binding protein